MCISGRVDYVKITHVILRQSSVTVETCNVYLS